MPFKRQRQRRRVGQSVNHIVGYLKAIIKDKHTPVQIKLKCIDRMAFIDGIYLSLTSGKLVKCRKSSGEYGSMEETVPDTEEELAEEIEPEEAKVTSAVDAPLEEFKKREGLL